MRIKALLCLMLTMQLISQSIAQDLIIGDTIGVGEITKKASAIYNEGGKSYFFLTKTQLLTEVTKGISITAYAREDLILRIVAISITDRGQYSSEWYFDDGKIIHSYQTYEFFAEYDDSSSWKNFKGLPGWESRYYFTEGKLFSHLHKGRSQMMHDFDEVSILRDAGSLLNYVSGQVK